MRLTQAFAASLGQPDNVFEPIYGERPNQLVKIIRYPGREATESDQGVGAHKDSGFVTILLQDKVSGLQVEGPDGWIDAPPIPGSFIINVGELLEMASQRLSARHCAPRGDAARRHRPAVGRASSSAHAWIRPCPCSRCRRQLAAEARGVSQDPHNPLFRDVGKNYLKGRLRSHPDVARRHYADLLSEEEKRATGPGSAY